MEWDKKISLGRQDLPDGQDKEDMAQTLGHRAKGSRLKG